MIPGPRDARGRVLRPGGFDLWGATLFPLALKIDAMLEGTRSATPTACASKPCSCPITVSIATERVQAA